MDTKVVKTNSGFTLGEMFMVGGAKVASEQLLNRFIGNGTLISGGVKIAGAYGVPKVLSGKGGQIIATALVVDGVEDIINAFLTGGVFASENQTEGSLI